jgi:hypothetical protein
MSTEKVKLCKTPLIVAIFTTVSYFLLVLNRELSLATDKITLFANTKARLFGLGPDINFHFKVNIFWGVILIFLITLLLLKFLNSEKTKMDTEKEHQYCLLGFIIGFLVGVVDFLFVGLEFLRHAPILESLAIYVQPYIFVVCLIGVMAAIARKPWLCIGTVIGIGFGTSFFTCLVAGPVICLIATIFNMLIAIFVLGVSYVFIYFLFHILIKNNMLIEKWAENAWKKFWNWWE